MIKDSQQFQPQVPDLRYIISFRLLYTKLYVQRYPKYQGGTHAKRKSTRNTTERRPMRKHTISTAKQEQNGIYIYIWDIYIYICVAIIHMPSPGKKKIISAFWFICITSPNSVDENNCPRGKVYCCPTQTDYPVDRAKSVLRNTSLGEEETKKPQHN